MSMTEWTVGAAVIHALTLYAIFVLMYVLVALRFKRRADTSRGSHSEEPLREGAYTAHNPTPLNALELQAPKGEVLAKGEIT
jgi:hypothetical protein